MRGVRAAPSAFGTRASDLRALSRGTKDRLRRGGAPGKRLRPAGLAAGAPLPEARSRRGAGLRLGLSGGVGQLHQPPWDPPGAAAVDRPALTPAGGAAPP